MNLVAETLLTIRKALGSVPSTALKNVRKERDLKTDSEDWDWFYLSSIKT